MVTRPDMCFDAAGHAGMRFARHWPVTGSPTASRTPVRAFALLPAHRIAAPPRLRIGRRRTSRRIARPDRPLRARRRIVARCAALVASWPGGRSGRRSTASPLIFSSVPARRGAHLLRSCLRTDVQALHESCNAGASQPVCDARYSMRGLRRSRAAAAGAPGSQSLRLALQLHDRKVGSASNEPVTEDHTRSIVSDSVAAFRETIRPRLDMYVPVDPNPRFVRIDAGGPTLRCGHGEPGPEAPVSARSPTSRRTALTAGAWLRAAAGAALPRHHVPRPRRHAFRHPGAMRSSPFGPRRPASNIRGRSVARRQRSVLPATRRRMVSAVCARRPSSASSRRQSCAGSGPL